MKIRDVMQPRVRSVRADALARHASEMLINHGFRHLPVVDEDEMLVGIISDRDLRNAGLALDPKVTHEDDAYLPGTVRVADLMTREPITVEAGDDVSRGVAVMRSRHFSALPVTSEGKLVGIVSYIDLLGLLEDLLESRS